MKINSKLIKKREMICLTGYNSSSVFEKWPSTKTHFEMSTQKGKFVLWTFIRTETFVTRKSKKKKLKLKYGV